MEIKTIQCGHCKKEYAWSEATYPAFCPRCGKSLALLTHKLIQIIALANYNITFLLSRHNPPLDIDKAK